MIFTTLVAAASLGISLVNGHGLPGTPFSHHPAVIQRRQREANGRHVLARNCAAQVAEYQSQRKARRDLRRRGILVEGKMDLKKRQDLTPHYSTIQNFTCVGAPEVTEGPYYLRNELVRQDLREDQAGTPLYLDIGVLDINTCEPATDVFVEIWAANAQGVYSAFGGAGTAATTVEKRQGGGIGGGAGHRVGGGGGQGGQGGPGGGFPSGGQGQPTGGGAFPSGGQGGGGFPSGGFPSGGGFPIGTGALTTATTSTDTTSTETSSSTETTSTETTSTDASLTSSTDLPTDIPTGAFPSGPAPSGNFTGGAPGGGGGSSSVANGDNFLRGGYAANENGVVELLTIYPGFYTGRTVHVHTMIHQGITVNDNGTVVSGSGGLRHIGQIFFDETINDEVLAQDAYQGSGNTRTYNSEDSILAGSNTGGYSAFASIELIGSDISEGLLGYITIGVDSEAEQRITTTNYYDPNFVARRAPEDVEDEE